MKLPAQLSLKLRALSERDRRALAVLAVAASLFLLARLVAFPLWDAAASSASAIPVREKALRKYRALADATAARESNFGAIKARLEEAESGLLKNRTGPLAAAEVQQQVRELAAQAGIPVRSGDFLPLRKLDAEYAAVPVSASFVASMDQLVGLLNALRGEQKTLALEQLRIGAANQADKKQVNVYLVVSGVTTAEALKPEGGKQ